tara:strand:+ start:560 stop:904 length:345 start_codon:yes stop_codon:yes gene_type:complete
LLIKDWLSASDSVKTLVLRDKDERFQNINLKSVGLFKNSPWLLLLSPPEYSRIFNGLSVSAFLTTGCKEGFKRGEPKKARGKLLASQEPFDTFVTLVKIPKLARKNESGERLTQ